MKNSEIQTGIFNWMDRALCSTKSTITTLFSRSRVEFNRFSSNFRPHPLLKTLSNRHMFCFINTLLAGEFSWLVKSTRSNLVVMDATVMNNLMQLALRFWWKLHELEIFLPYDHHIGQRENMNKDLYSMRESYIIQRKYAIEFTDQSFLEICYLFQLFLDKRISCRPVELVGFSTILKKI